VDSLYLTEKILRELRQRQDDLTDVLKTGGVQDWNSYQKILGELTGLSSAERIVIDLQNIQEQNDGD
tara:strand:- start:440 stop:640 length:201 start_codon:yes stop_codon:yes gene_type:complete